MVVNPPHVFKGVEISCADKLHVVGIFDAMGMQHDKIEQWLNDNIMSVKDGTIHTSSIVLDEIEKIGGAEFLLLAELLAEGNFLKITSSEDRGK
jgi:hypothetical protein